MNDSEAELAQVGNYPNIRVFKNAQIYASSPLEDVKSIATQWSLPNASMYIIPPNSVSYIPFKLLHNLSNVEKYCFEINDILHKYYTKY